MQKRRNTIQLTCNSSSLVLSFSCTSATANFLLNRLPLPYSFFWWLFSLQCDQGANVGKNFLTFFKSCPTITPSTTGKLIWLVNSMVNYRSRLPYLRSLFPVPGGLVAWCQTGKNDIRGQDLARTKFWFFLSVRAKLRFFLSVRASSQPQNVIIPCILDAHATR